MQFNSKVENNIIAIMDRKSIPSELTAIGVESITVNKHIRDTGIPQEDIKKLVNVIKSL
jgi:hypothetical protein